MISHGHAGPQDVVLQPHKAIILLLLTHELFSLPSDGAVSVPHGSYVVREGNKLSINCSVTGEAIIGWFTSGGQEITSNPSERVHVRTDGHLKYLEIRNVNKADRGMYECRGSNNNTRVMLYVECKCSERERTGAITHIVNFLSLSGTGGHFSKLGWGG